MTPSLKLKISLLLSLFFCLAFCTRSSAQRLFFIYAHALYATPVDKNFKDGYNSGLGVEGGAAVGWGKTFIVGTIGYTSFSDKDGNPAGNTSFVPVKIGLRQFVFSKLIYVHGDLGIGKIKNDLTTDSRFSGDIGAGVKLAGFEVQLDYDGFSRKGPSGYASWIALKAGFHIGL